MTEGSLAAPVQETAKSQQGETPAMCTEHLRCASAFFFVESSQPSYKARISSELETEAETHSFKVL